MVDKFKSMYAKIKLREIRKKVNDPDYPFDELDILVYGLIVFIALISLIVALCLS